MIETTLDISLNSQSDVSTSVIAETHISAELQPEQSSSLMVNVNPLVQLVNANSETRFIARVRPLVQIEVEIEEFDDSDVMSTIKEAEVITRFPSWIRNDYVNRIKRLKCFEIVREMVLNGIPDVEIARKIHQLGECQNLKVESLKLNVQHYRNTIPAWVLSAKQQPKAFLEIQKKVERQIDIMEKLANLYEMIEKRLENCMAIDEKFGLITGGIERSFHVAKELLMTIQMMREKLGIGPGQEGRLLGGASPVSNSSQVDWNKIYARESVAKVMNDPDSRARVVRTAERLLDLYAKKLTAEQLDTLFDSTRLANPAPISEGDPDLAVTIDSL